MGTAITYALNMIKRSIPPQILERFFKPVQYQQLRRDPFQPTSIDNQIIEKVINGQVRLDCDIAGATEATIPLKGLPIELIDQGKYVIHIPKSLTGGRWITSALALIYYGIETAGYNNALLGGGVAGYSNAYTQCNNGQLNPAAAMAKSVQPMIVSQTSNVRIIDGQTLLVEELITPTPNAYLRCILSNDREFSTLAQPAWHAFGHLCQLAVKAYIYNNFIIEIDMAELVGGQELGRFKEIVEGYSDAQEQYNEYYTETWRKVQFMSDESRHTRFIKSLIGRYK